MKINCWVVLYELRGLLYTNIFALFLFLAYWRDQMYAIFGLYNIFLVLALIRLWMRIVTWLFLRKFERMQKLLGKVQGYIWYGLKFRMFYLCRICVGALLRSRRKRPHAVIITDREIWCTTCLAVGQRTASPEGIALAAGRWLIVELYGVLGLCYKNCCGGELNRSLPPSPIVDPFGQKLDQCEGPVHFHIRLMAIFTRIFSCREHNAIIPKSARGHWTLHAIHRFNFD